MSERERFSEGDTGRCLKCIGERERFRMADRRSHENGIKRRVKPKNDR